MKIKPDAVFAKIENTINEFMTEATLTPEFKVDFLVMPQTLQFNMVDENQIKLIIAVVTTMIKRIQEMVMASNKPETEYIMTYPFESRTETEKALVEIIIQYRRDARFIGKRVTVIRV
jgi:hypothetical protein